MSKQGQRNSDRKRQLEAVRAQQRRADRQRWVIVGVGSAVAVLLVGGAVWAGMSSTGSTANAASSSASSSAAIPGLQTYTGLSRDHVTGKVSYPQTPPVGGAHNPVWQNCGIYNAPVANENAVHSLEHGAIWITYQPNLPAAQLAVIKADVAGQQYGLVSPYPGLPSPVVATVWGAQLKLGSASDPRLKTFIAAYQSGQRAPERGGECTGGIGTRTG
ncbi:MAG TPA: DUF3105 domain-containing protein [Actinomycetes bacterium]